MSNKIEKRTFSYEGEVRADDNGKEHMVGHAAVFNTETDLGWNIREQIAPSAFDEAILNDDVRALINHDSNLVLARKNKRTNTLKLSVDEQGLAVDIDPPGTSYANDLKISMERRDVDQMSFAFEVLKQSWEEKDGYDLRTIEKAKLWDVSVVTFPAYTETDVALHCRDAWKSENKQPEPYDPWREAIDKDKVELTLKEVF